MGGPAAEQPEPVEGLTRSPGRRGRGEGEWEALLPIIVCPGEGGKPSKVWHADRLPPTLKVASTKTATGHDTEVAIPAAYLDRFQGGRWKEFRLNVAVDDYDGPGRGAQIWWRPDWRRDRNFAGSGTFRR